MVRTKLPELMGKKKIRSLAELARVTGLNRRTLTNIYDEKTKGIDYATINALCAFFDCTISDLLEYVPDQE